MPLPVVFVMVLAAFTFGVVTAGLLASRRAFEPEPWLADCGVTGLPTPLLADAPAATAKSVETVDGAPANRERVRHYAVDETLN